jgi:SSS family solute:Na+ symporter
MGPAASSNQYWVEAIPAMLILGVVMMPLYYICRTHSVPGYLQRLLIWMGAHALPTLGMVEARVSGPAVGCGLVDRHGAT